tara:strand:- start:130 stop:276 length:147 start_codon:yes stop_codon:yes gene_type:complete
MIKIGDKNLNFTFEDTDEMLEFFCGLDLKSQKRILTIIAKTFKGIKKH